MKKISIFEKSSIKLVNELKKEAFFDGIDDVENKEYMNRMDECDQILQDFEKIILRVKKLI